MGCLTFLFLFTLAFIGSDVIARRRLDPNAGGETYIVGGTEANITDYPYMGYLVLFDGADYYECGSSIISRRYVLSAAHCFPNIKSATVRIGSSNKNSGGSVYNSSTFFVHPRYNSTTFDYDAALVLIEEGMALDGTNSRRVKLIRGGENIPGGTNVLVTGWGRTEEGGSSPEMLRVVEVPVLTNADCMTQVNGVTSRMLCAGLDEGGKDSCQGDSGGPAVNDSKQVAIVSNGVGCARPHQPGVYTNLTNYQIRRWIRLTTGV